MIIWAVFGRLLNGTYGELNYDEILLILQNNAYLEEILNFVLGGLHEKQENFNERGIAVTNSALSLGPRNTTENVNGFRWFEDKYESSFCLVFFDIRKIIDLFEAFQVFLLVRLRVTLR